MSGVIRFNKALPFFKKNFGKNYCPNDIYDDFLFSNEIDLFIPINDASICEVSQNGFSDDNFSIYRIYPYSGYASIKIDDRVLSLLNTDITSISINEITGLYDSKKGSTRSINASLFNKDINYNYYNSQQDFEMTQLNEVEGHKNLNLDINLANIFFSRDQLSHIGLNLEELPLKNSTEANPIRIKEEKSIGLIIAAFAELAKIDISVPNSNNHKENLLPVIDSLDPDGKEMDSKTLAKYIEYAIKYSQMKTKKNVV